jgi:predicted hydrolase (HD superfamily)
MPKTDVLEGLVRELYDSAKPELKADWTQWLYQNHVFVVAANARRVAPLFQADPDLAAAGGMLHDIADVKMKRQNPNHKAETLRISTGLLQEAGFSDADVHLLVSDAIPKHSCHGTDLPTTPEGRAVAAGDALAHLTTDFYIHGTWSMGKNGRELE